MARVPTAKPSGEEGAPGGRGQRTEATEAYATKKPDIQPLEVSDPSLSSQRAGETCAKSVRVTVAIPCSTNPVGHVVTAGAEGPMRCGERKTVRHRRSPRRLLED